MLLQRVRRSTGKGEGQSEDSLEYLSSNQDLSSDRKAGCGLRLKTRIQQTKGRMLDYGASKSSSKAPIFYSKLRYTGLFLHTFYRDWLHKASSPSTETTTKSSTNSQDPQGPREE